MHSSTKSDELVAQHLKHYGYYTGVNEKFTNNLYRNRLQYQKLKSELRKHDHGDETISSKRIPGTANRVTSAFDSRTPLSNSLSKSSLDFEPTLKELGFLQKLCERTTQLRYEIDPDSGKAKCVLKEPRNLYSIQEEFQTNKNPVVRYPAAYPIIDDEDIKFDYSKRPVLPEEFYVQTGNEYKPRISLYGPIAYWNQHNEQLYFRKSAIGGKSVNSGNLAELYNHVHTKSYSTPILQFESRFECGNLHKAVRTNEFAYELELRPDLYSQQTQWFLFRVENAQPGRCYRFTIVNLYKKSSLYNQGMKPLIYTDRAGWKREGSDIVYYKNEKEDEKDPFILVLKIIKKPVL